MNPTEKKLGVLFGSDGRSGQLRDGEVYRGAVGTTDIRLLQSGDREDFVRIHIPGNFLRCKGRPSLERVGSILNLITDPDLNPKVLGYARDYLKPFKGKIFNRPEAVMTSSRDQVAARLAGIDGLIVPRVARFKGRPNLALAAIEKAGVPFPAILRGVGTHDGRIDGLVTDREAMLALLDPSSSYFLTEFVDMRAPGDLYHKIRIIFFGRRSVIRHRFISDHWNIHSPDRDRVLVHHPADIAEERRLNEGGIAALPTAVQKVLLEIRGRMPLDYFGVDFGIMPDGRVLLFEANATMMFFPFTDNPLFAYNLVVLGQAQQAYDAMLREG